MEFLRNFYYLKKSLIVNTILKNNYIFFSNSIKIILNKVEIRREVLFFLKVIDFQKKIFM